MTHHSSADALPPPEPPEPAGRILSNPPLQEAVFEFRWALDQREGGMLFPVDPYYRIAAGRFFDRVSSEFPKYESLPTFEMPDALAAYVVQHRWSASAGAPLLQLGPGVLSVNEVRPQEYRWPAFREECLRAYDTLHASYPVVLTPLSISFRYINSVAFDFMRDDALEFIATNLNADAIGARRILPEGVSKAPVHFQSTQAFRSSSPHGVVSIVFASIVNQQSEKRLTWQLMFETRGASLPTTLSDMKTWLEDSHAMLEEMFFNMIKGKLERLFA